MRFWDFENHPSVVLIRNKSFNLDFSFEPVTPAYVADLLIGLNVKKSCGPDGLSPKILQIAAPAIISTLTKLMNFCIESAQWPKQWKLSNVSPVYKKEEETIKLNYRPVSVLSTISKLLERVKYDQLYNKFLPTFSVNMSGFLRGHSCCTA